MLLYEITTELVRLEPWPHVPESWIGDRLVSVLLPQNGACGCRTDFEIYECSLQGLTNIQRCGTQRVVLTEVVRQREQDWKGNGIFFRKKIRENDYNQYTRFSGPQYGDPPFRPYSTFQTEPYIRLGERFFTAPWRRVFAHLLAFTIHIDTTMVPPLISAWILSEVDPDKLRYIG